jgi:glutaminyl-peptide cyclotransferase
MKTKIYLLLLAGFAGFALFTSCGGNKKKNNITDTTSNKPSVNIPVFNEDTAYTFVEQQVKFGPRVPNTPAQNKCAEYFVSKLKTYLKNVIVQETKVKAFNGKMLNCKNIIASFKPEINNRIFLSAHWDSRPFADNDPDPKNYNTPIDGANDGASGAGILLEIARQISLNNPKIGVDIILFDAEDYGQPEFSKEPKVENSWCLGSQYWAKNPHKPKYYAKYGILLDMVGGRNATFPKEGNSLEYAPDVVRIVWNAAFKAGYSNYFVEGNMGQQIIDDHLYVNQIIKIPTIDIIHLNQSGDHSFPSEWHTLNDNIKVIDRNTLKAVGQTLMTVIYEEQ